MRLATREEIYSIDQCAADDYGLSSSVLIEKAGAALARAFEEIFTRQNWSKNSRVGIWCGVGHNGADGRVMAHLLREKSYTVEVLSGTDWHPRDFDILVDALFGVGLNRPIEGLLATKITEINKSRCQIIAVDIPSGLDANRGIVLGVCVKAHWTLTIAPAKPGMFLQEGPRLVGRVRSLQIGFPIQLLKSQANSVFLIGESSAQRLLPRRGPVANKTSFGHLLVVAGAEGMEGAALLASEAAARMGCGYVTLCSPSKHIFKQCRPDFLRLSINEFFKSNLNKYSAVIVGPGLGVNKRTQRILNHLWRVHSKVLVDADALTVLAQLKLKTLPNTWLLTPHAGELSRLIGISAKELEGDRLNAIEQAQKQLKSLVLFKGFRTVLGAAEKKYIIGTGNVALAKAGSGDVLSGFIGSLMAQGLPTDKAAVLGAYLHGKIADDWLRRGHTNRTLMASDLPELIDASLTSLKKGGR